MLIAQPLHISFFFPYSITLIKKKSHLKNESDFELKIPNSNIKNWPEYDCSLFTVETG